MSEEREHWITTVSQSYRYYRVKARTKREALQKHQAGLAECVVSNESPDQRVVKVLSEKPHASRR